MGINAKSISKMKNLKYIIFLLLILPLIATSCQTTGGVWLKEGERKGTAYKFGGQKMTDNILGLAKAYSNRDTEKLFPYYSEEYMTEEMKASYKKSLDTMKSVSMVPYKIIPLVGEDGKYKQVLAWSDEERVYKNGSYEKLNLMELFLLDDQGKVTDFKQWKAIDSVNFGMPYGGKFFGREKNENSGRPFVFSNRGETSILEKLVEDYNKMNSEGFKSAFAEEFTLNTYDGKTMKLKKSDLGNLFKPYKSVDWSPIAMVPIKIRNTDAASGVIVYSSEKRVFKNGRKWKKDLMEIFYFDLEGKISSMVQFAR